MLLCPRELSQSWDPMLGWTMSPGDKSGPRDKSGTDVQWGGNAGKRAKAASSPGAAIQALSHECP